MQGTDRRENRRNSGAAPDSGAAGVDPDPERTARDLLALAAGAPDPAPLLAAAQELLTLAAQRRAERDKVLKLPKRGQC